VEAQNFSIRKHLLEYDDVMNQQRLMIYQQRREAMQGENLKPAVMDMIEDLVEGLLAEYTDVKTYAEDWDLESLNNEALRLFGSNPQYRVESMEDVTQEGLREDLLKRIRERYDARERDFGEPLMRELENYIILQTVDSLWKDHLLNMDHLKEGIGLRGYAQQDPLLAYKREGHAMFQEMIERLKEETVRLLLQIQVQREAEVQQLRQEQEQQPMYYGPGEAAAARPQVVRKDRKIGRNDPCPCGSGKKYKKCCGQ
jgi:preprotein translocase subunit SecA